MKVLSIYILGIFSDAGEVLEHIGINIGLVIAGLFGSFLSVSVNPELNNWQRGTVMVAGSMSANYITPLILSLIKLNEGVEYGLAFIVGFGGLKFVEWIIVRIKHKYGKEK